MIFSVMTISVSYLNMGQILAKQVETFPVHSCGAFNCTAPSKDNIEAAPQIL